MTAREPAQDLALARQVAGMVSALSGVDVEAMMARTRIVEVVQSRWVVWALLRDLGWSLPRIAQPWGCHHTTVLHGCERIAGSRLLDRASALLDERAAPDQLLRFAALPASERRRLLDEADARLVLSNPTGSAGMVAL